MSPTIIFEGDIVKQPWEYTLSPKLDENLRSALADYLINLKWDCEYDSTSKIYTQNVQDIITKYPSSNSAVQNFFTEIASKQFHNSIAEYYGLHKFYNNVTVVVDKCEPNSFNGNHTDLKNSKHCITLQYYIVLDDNNQCIKLNDKKSNIKQGYGFMFKAHMNTMHSFDPGSAYRYSVRVRIRYDLVDPLVVNNKSNDDLSVIIDCKDMETGWDIEEHIEECLGNVTYHSLVDAGFSNITLFSNMNDFQQAIKTTTTDKVLILFAGALVSDKTYQWAKSAQGQWGMNLDDDKEILRQFFLFEKSKLTGNLDNKGKYLSEQYDNTNFINLDKIDIFYKHPDEGNFKYIEGLIFPNKIDQLGKDQYRVKKLMHK